jgi:hypothetical protein
MAAHPKSSLWWQKTCSQRSSWVWQSTSLSSRLAGGQGQRPRSIGGGRPAFMIGWEDESMRSQTIG